MFIDTEEFITEFGLIIKGEHPAYNSAKDREQDAYNFAKKCGQDFSIESVANELAEDLHKYSQIAGVSESQVSAAILLLRSSI